MQSPHSCGRELGIWMVAGGACGWGWGGVGECPVTGSKAEPVAEMVLPSGWGQGIEQPITPPPERTLVFGAVRGTEISAQPGKLAGREKTLISRHCPVKTHIMEPRAAQVRRRERLGRQQKDRPSREGEPCSGGAGRPGGIGGGDVLARGGSCYPPSILPAVLGGQERQTPASAS